MVLHLFSGFEMAPNVANSMVSSSVQAKLGRDGVGKAIGGAGSGGSVTVPFPASTTVIVGFGWLGETTNAVDQLLTYTEAGSRSHLMISKAADGRARLELGSTTVATSSGVHFGLNTWAYVEVKYTCADVGGNVIIRVNGVEAINYTGDTKNGGAGTSLQSDSVSLRLGGSLGYSRMDDLYICDTTGPAPFNDFLGERVVKAKRPVGNGALSALVGSDGDSTDNYLLVDDDPIGITDYVASNVANAKDLYALSAATGLLTVDAVQTHLHASKSDSGARSLKQLIRNDGTGTVDTGPSQPVSTSWTTFTGPVRLTNPDGAPWTPVNVNAIQAGMEVI